LIALVLAAAFSRRPFESSEPIEKPGESLRFVVVGAATFIPVLRGIELINLDAEAELLSLKV
jgi:hypothetical protein